MEIPGFIYDPVRNRYFKDPGSAQLATMGIKFNEIKIEKQEKKCVERKKCASLQTLALRGFSGSREECVKRVANHAQKCVQVDDFIGVGNRLNSQVMNASVCSNDQTVMLGVNHRNQFQYESVFFLDGKEIFAENYAKNPSCLKTWFDSSTRNFMAFQTLSVNSMSWADLYTFNGLHVEKQQGLISNDDNILCAKISKSMSLSSFGCERKCISLLGERSQPFSSDRKILRIGKSDCLAVEVSNKPNTRLFAGGFRNGSILIANADELRNYSDPKDCILEFKMKSSISRICFLNDDQYMLSSSVNGDINLWDFRLPGKPLKTLEGNVNEYKILPSAIHESSEQYFAALGDDRKIRIWDIWGFNVHPIFEYHAPFNVNSLEFDSNSELKLCLATDDGIKMIKVI